MSFGFDYMQSVRRIKVLIIGGSLATLFVLGMEVWREHFSGMWRSHQSRYATMLPEEFRAHFEIGLKQAFLPDLSRVDRCQTCHIGIENPAMKDAELPLRAHSGTLLDKHSPETFGCTVCHQGQGRATWLPDAHGDVPHWEEPLLRGPLVYTSCGRCHVENSPFGEFTEQFGGRVADAEIYVGDLERNIPGATLLGRGKALFLRSGCLGCHVYRGQGGSHAPDLTHVGDKGVHGYDFSHLPPGRERTPLQWLIEHFLDPGAVSPGTVMPDMGVNREEALGLAAYMLSLRSQSVPSRYRAPSMRAKGEPAGGKRLYELFCVACHGKDLAGSQVPEIRTPTLSNADLLSVASDEYLEAIITHGRSGTKMPSWSAGGLTKGQIKRLVTYIRSFERKSAELASVSPHRGDAAFGKALYRGNCANCHGKKGEGGIGTALGSQEFLMMASDEFLARVVVEGRPDSGMPSWKRLSSVEISDILAYIRSWQDTGARKEEVLSRLESGAGRPAHGEDIYQSKCRDCHGTDARGAIGPSLIAKDLISRVSNEYLVHAIRDGRPGTAMPSWTTLTTQEICDLISYLRLASKARYRKVTAPILQGDPANGGLLYRQACESCHGPKGVGGVGPQLANRVFLDHASDRFLYETIGYGLEGTPMRGFLKGSKGGAGIAEFSPTQISDLVAYVKSLRFRPLDRSLVRPVLGNTARGREIYEERGGCVACHGTHGEGALGTALGNPRFLDQVTEGFLIGTMVLGRGGTQMRQYGSWGTAKLSLADFMDVAAYLRTLPSQRPAGPTGSRSFSLRASIGSWKRGARAASPR
ncbi:MAG: c-type cytochrome [Planctomycetota bacterium]